MKDVAWLPLYYISLIIFIVSIAIFPVDARWTMVGIFFIISLWSQIPGIAVHFSLNTASMHDFFAFIVAISMGTTPAIVFVVCVMLLKKVIGPKTWTPYLVRILISFTVSIAAIPLIQQFTSSIPYIYLGYAIVGYAVYYGLVVLFFREELALEIAILPSIVFFDFAMNYVLIFAFGEAINRMFTQGIFTSANFIIFVAIFLGYFWLSRNGHKIVKIMKKPEQQQEPEKKPSYDVYHYMTTGEKKYEVSKETKKEDAMTRWIKRLSGNKG